MNIIPRDYQDAAVTSIFDYFQDKNGNPLIAMPTGTGKSIVIALFLYRVLAAYHSQRIMVLTHVKELIEQNYQKLATLWPGAPAGIYSAGLNRRDIGHNIIFGGVASVVKKVERFGHIDLILVDEAHLVSPRDETMYQKLIGALKQVNPHLKVIGFTATPWRLGHGSITQDSLFTDTCFDMTSMEAFNWLLSQGYLLPPVPKRTEHELDIDGVHMRGGEYISSELQRAVDKETITRNAFEEALQWGANRRKWLVFCAGVEHSIHAAEILNDMGISAAAVHSKMKGKERDDLLAASRAGHIQAITNNNVLTTGYDDPEIDLEIILRPTASPVLWVQMLGRGTRPCYAPGYDLTTKDGRLASIGASPKQDCLVLDFAGNTRRLGPINDPVVPRRKGKKSDGEAPVKECPVCATWNHASVRHCTECGHEFVVQTKLRATASTDQLVKEDVVPEVEMFPIDYVTYALHQKKGKPPSMRVMYYSGLRRFDEYVSLEHPNFAGHKARRWWEKRSNVEPPVTTVDALGMADTFLKVPTHLNIWVNKRFPEIVGTSFDGGNTFS